MDFFMTDILKMEKETAASSNDFEMKLHDEVMVN